MLLAAAQAQPKFIEGLERQLAAFVADKDLKRWVQVGGGTLVTIGLLPC